MSESGNKIASQLQQLAEIGQWIQANRWCPATSGNLSTREQGHQHFWISVSGKYKGELAQADFIEIGEQGEPISSDKKPSAETLLHRLIYRRFSDATYVLHTHSIYGTVLSQAEKSGQLVLRDLELQKAFSGVETHEGDLTIPVFANSQDMVALSEQIDEHIEQCNSIHGFLLAGHGLYTWGNNASAAKRHLEALEFLFECEYKLRLLATTSK